MLRPLRIVKVGESLVEAQSDVFAEQFHCFRAPAFGHGIQNPPMKTMYFGDQRQRVMLARQREHPQEKTGGIEDFQHPLIARGLEQ